MYLLVKTAYEKSFLNFGLSVHAVVLQLTRISHVGLTHLATSHMTK